MTRDTRESLDYAFAFVGILSILLCVLFGDPDVRRVSIGVLIGAVGVLINRPGSSRMTTSAPNNINVGEGSFGFPRLPNGATAYAFVALAILTVTNPALASILGDVNR
jgi:hypothetical protein